MSSVRLPEYEEVVYIPTSLHLSRGKDDIKGGKARIKNFTVSKDKYINDYNRIFVRLYNIPSRYNWRYLLEDQEKWAEYYGDQWAHPDPDNRLEFNRW